MYLLLALMTTGFIPTIVSCNSIILKIYNDTSSLGSAFWKKKFSFAVKNAPTYYSSGVVVVNSKVVGLAPG
jgi:hypothetical protein